MLLRIAIGWHFLTEGLEKYHADKTGKPFSAEMYLKNANGPFAPYFRGMLPDPNGIDLLTPERLKQAWTDDVARIERFYGFDEDQKGLAEKRLAEAVKWADQWFAIPDNAHDRDKYFHDLRQAMLVERDPKAMSFEKERAWDARKELEGDRRKLTAPILEQAAALRADIIGKATPDQKEAKAKAIDLTGSGPQYQGPTTFLDVVNVMTKYGLIVMGVCLILGLMTPFAALCAAAFLGMIYLSMPPWPGLPDNPKVEGHYFIVSKNLIELIACLLIACTPSAHWLGLDALLFGARRRRRLARLDAAEARAEADDLAADESARYASRH
ncbi:DoxX family protein [Paludisphaera rhizosphaerae]|uniref:DoxX family protein n=1 Tax=Paludisphaera rhizosphaerae TaxID=2711216 RepID=UPI00197F5FFF|nr:DoxX family protein [Paludisphaera rhizosphaerae]